MSLAWPNPAGCHAAGIAAELNDAEVEEAVFFAFDDHAIPYHGNLQLAMERAEKHPANPVMPIGRPGTPAEGTIRMRVRLEGRERNAIRLHAIYLRP